MAVTAKFQADFSSFLQAIDKAEVALVDFGKGAGKVESSLNKMVDSFSGRKLIQEASLMTIAVEKAGGVAKLTAQEIERVGTKANEAADKMKRLGYDVPEGLQKLADETKKTAGATDGLTVSFGKFVAGLVTAQAIIGAIKGVYSAFVGELSSSIKAAGDAEKSHVQLVAALRAQGTAIPSVVTAFQGYATALQKTTIYQDDAIEGAEALLVTIGNVMPRDMEKALKATTNLASGLGIDLDTAARTVAKAAEGNTTALRKVGVVMDDTKGKTHDFGEVLDAITAKFGGQAEAIAGTYQGRIAQLGNTWNNVEESIGRVITQNATVLEAFNLVNRAIDENTTEANANATVNNLVSASVIGAVKAFSLLVEAGGFVVKEYYAVYKVVADVIQVFDLLNLSAEKFERFKLQSSDLFGADPKVTAQIKELDGAIASVTARIEARGKALKDADASQASVDAKTAEYVKQLADLTTKLEATRGKTNELKDVTDGAANAWDRHTTAVHKTSAAETQYAAALAELSAAGEGWRGTLDGIDGAVVESIKFYLEAGVSQDKLATAFGLTAVQVKAIESALKAEKGAAKDILEIHNKIEAGLYGLHTAVGLVDESELKFVETQVKVGDALKLVERSIPSAVAGFYSMGASLENVGIKSTEIDELRLKLKAFESTATAVFQRLPEMLIAGFTGGGGAIGALKAFATDLGAALFGEKGVFASVTKSATAGLSKIFGTTIGGALGAAIPGIGALIGPAIGALWNGIGKLFGNNAEKAINPIREAFVQAAGGLDALNKHAHDAGVTLDALLNAKTPEQYQKAIDDLNAAFGRLDKTTADLDKWISDSNTDLGGLLHAFQDVGGKLPATLDPTIQKLIDMGRITGDNADLIAALSGSTEVDFKKMQSVAEKYGIDLSKLGPAFQQAKLSDAAKGIINDFDLLSRGGADVDAVLAGMKKPINDLVNDSLKFGLAIPANMKPWIDQLLLTHQLVDENGKEITDLGQLKFADPIKTEFQILIDKIGQLIDKLTGPLPDAINNLPKPAPITIPITYEVNTPQNGGEEGIPGARAFASMGGVVTDNGVQHFARGGRVLSFMPRGTDTVPAMLTPGEMVLTKRQQAALGIGSGQPSTTESSGGGDLHISLQLDGRDVTKTVIKNFRLNKGGAYTQARGALGLAS